MKFAVVTLGSAGDLHPFLAVARALAERGHGVHLLAQAPHESAVRAEGVGFVPIASREDHDRTLGHPLLWHPLHGFGVLWRHLAVPAIGPTIQALDVLSREESLTVLASPLAAGARLARERWPDRIRLLSGYTAPMGLRSTADPMFLGAWHVPGWVPSSARRGLWWALDRWKLEPMARPALQHWSGQLGLRTLQGSLFGDALHSPDGGIAMYPDWFAPVPAAWKERGIRQTGFPVFEPTQADGLPRSLAQFLEDARPFVVMYPGSAEQEAQTFAERVLPTSLSLGFRVLVLSRVRRDRASNPEVLQLDSAPLSQVLPLASGFLHHGGIGSAAQGLVARTPQLIMASAYDQFENGARLERLRQGCSQRLFRTSPRSIRDVLQTFHCSGRSPALMYPPQASFPGAPNPAVEETCEMLENSSKQIPLPGLAADSALRFRQDRAESEKPLLGYHLLLTLIPTKACAHQIAEAGASMTSRLRLKGKRIPEERLHITLHSLATFPADNPPARALVDAAIAAGCGTVRPSLKLCFSSAMTFPESGAFVLRCDSGSDHAIAELRQLLTRALQRAGLRPRAAGTPHMTLLYDRRYVPEHEIDPLSWTAGGLALILSHVGQHHHQRVYEWPLSGSAE